MRLDTLIPFHLNRQAVRAELMIKNEAGLGEPEAARIKRVAQEFEALLLEQMIQVMRKTVPESPIFGVNRGREIFNDMLDGEFARLMENRGGIGIAAFLETRMHRDMGPMAPESIQVFREKPDSKSDGFSPSTERPVDPAEPHPLPAVWDAVDRSAGTIRERSLAAQPRRGQTMEEIR